MARSAFDEVVEFRPKAGGGQDITFSAPVWLYQGGQASWHFVTLTADAADAVRRLAPPVRRGWKSVRVTARIGGSSWNTSVFPEQNSGSFILPLKADIRKREGIALGDEVTVTLKVA